MSQVRFRPSAVLEGPEVLLVARSHGFPPTRARLERPAEIAKHLSGRGAACDAVIFIEKVLQPAEEDALEELRSLVRELEVIPHPVVDSPFYRIALRARDALSLKTRLGGFSHCPARLLSALRSRSAARDYRAVVVTGVHLARAASVFPAWTEKLIDVERIGHDVHRDHERQGRGDALQVFEDAAREVALLELSDAVLVASAAEAARLRDLGFHGDLVLAPPAVGSNAEPGARGASSFSEPTRPPRILCIGSETIANLDGLRWFRRQVFPRIVRAVPTCRLRIAGEVARHIEPGPSVDRIGWVDRLDEEYRDAAVVALPLRMGAGVHRRAVEALARGKALAATPVGAAGTGAVHLRDAVVTEDAAALASEIARVLSSDAVRGTFERRAQAIARDRFRADRAFASLTERLGLDSRSREREASLAGLFVPA